MGDYGDELRNGWANRSIPIFTATPSFTEMAAVNVRLGPKMPKYPHVYLRDGIDRGILLVTDPGCAKYLGNKITHVGSGR